MNLRIIRPVILELAHYDLDTGTFMLTTAALLAGDKLVIAEVTHTDAGETVFILGGDMDGWSTPIPNDAWMPVELSERDTVELTCQLRAAGNELKSLPVSIDLFVEVWNDRRFQSLEDVAGYFRFDERTLKSYRRSAKRLGYKLRNRRREPKLDVDGLNALVKLNQPAPWAANAAGEGEWIELPQWFHGSMPGRN